MNQTEKSKLSYQRILQAGVAEFGKKSYEKASVNLICSENGISKGLFYHNFSSKDELYIKCVSFCFENFLNHLKQFNYEYENYQKSIHEILKNRQQFLQNNPELANIFFDSVLQPPSHLDGRLSEIRKPFNEFQAWQYRQILQHLNLRQGITIEKGVEYFFITQELYNTYFQKRVRENGNFDEMVSVHEDKLYKLIDIMLYGIAEKDL